jgi:hypothetical protein
VRMFVSRLSRVEEKRFQPSIVIFHGVYRLRPLAEILHWKYGEIAPLKGVREADIPGLLRSRSDGTEPHLENRKECIG